MKELLIITLIVALAIGSILILNQLQSNKVEKNRLETENLLNKIEESKKMLKNISDKNYYLPDPNSNEKG